MIEISSMEMDVMQYVRQRYVEMELWILTRYVMMEI